ncbi:MAG: hypothetical protein U0Q22_17530 [Acidimicrobiales bacterium]
MWHDWERIAARLTEDEGALVDVRSAGVGAAGWQRLLNLPTEQGWWFQYAEDGVRLPVPPADVIPTRRSTVFCSFEFQVTPTFGLRTAFLDSVDVELWFDPRTLRSHANVSSLLSFVRILGRTLCHDVTVTADNHPEWVYLRYAVESDSVVEEVNPGGPER